MREYSPDLFAEANISLLPRLDQEVTRKLHNKPLMNKKFRKFLSKKRETPP